MLPGTSTPSLLHWNRNGGAPSASTANSAGSPMNTCIGRGWRTMPVFFRIVSSAWFDSALPLGPDAMQL